MRAIPCPKRNDDTASFFCTIEDFFRPRIRSREFFLCRLNSQLYQSWHMCGSTSKRNSIQSDKIFRFSAYINDPDAVFYRNAIRLQEATYDLLLGINIQDICPRPNAPPANGRFLKSFRDKNPYTKMLRLQ